MKKVTIRIFLSVFVLWFFSLWLNIVYGQSSSVNTPEQCSQVTNYSPNWYSSNSTNWTTYTTNTNVLGWYVNNTNAPSLAAAWNANNAWVCGWNYIAWSNAEAIQWKKSLCNSSFSNLQAHQTSLFNKYIQVQNYNNSTPRWFNSHQSVWALQNLMIQVSCHNNNAKDCKLWVNTISNFLFCNVCSEINNKWIELKTLTPTKTCEDWYTLTDDNLCCMPTPECVAPIVKINWEENKTTYSEEKSLEIVIDYSNNEWEINFPDNLNDMIVIDPGSALISEIVKTSKTITFSLSTEWTNSISISIEDELVKLGTKQCPWINITLEREAPCQNVNERQQCSNSGSFDAPDAPEEPITDYSFLENKICNKNWAEIEFCPCKTPPENNNCNKYWTGRYLKDDCCNKCPSNKKVNEEWDDCVCTTSSSCNQSWYVFNDETCKCECDPTQRCCGILLNTVVPFIGDCIEMTTQNSISDPSDPNKSRVNQLNAFPFLMMWLSKILVTIILIFSFLIIIAAWLMMTTGVYKEQNYKTWVDRITKVIVWLILLWASGLILRLINPSFFGW